MITKTRTTLLAVLCATALFAGACGGSSNSSTDIATNDTADTSDTQSTSRGNGSGDGTSSESPLAAVLGIPFDDDDAMAEYFSDLSRRAEITIAECMLAEGFEYQVVDYSVLDALDSAVDFESREFAEQYGFGIASNPFEDSFESIESFEDPNQTYIESLSDGEREAFQSALSGELPDLSSGDLQSFEPAGCQGNAYEELFTFSRVFGQFGDAFEEMEEAYDADPRVVSASSGWSECMGEAGYNFADIEGAEDDIRRRYDAIVNDPDAFAESGSESDGDVVFLGPGSLKPEVQADVDELAVAERAVAVASWDCNETLRKIEDEVRLEYEQRFVDANGAAIAAALDE